MPNPLSEFSYDHDPLWLPQATQPLSDDLTDLCPGCSALLEPCLGWYTREDGSNGSYEGVRCPTGCNLEEFYD